MIRKINAQDRELFLALLDEFYHSPAVLHPVPAEYFVRTFETLTSGSPFVEAFLLESEAGVAGYAQVSYSYSTEAGGIVAWIEEVYIRPAFQGKGLGAQFFRTFEADHIGSVARIRLEVEADNAGAIRLYERLGYADLPYKQMSKALPDPAHP